MGWHFGTVAVGVALGGALLLTCGVCEAAAPKAPPKAPPAPPVTVKQFPKPTSKPPVPKIIRLAPGKKIITTEQLRTAPSVYVANQRGKSHAAKPLSRPTPVPVPGAPRILDHLPLPDSHPPAPQPVPQKPAVKPLPKR